MSRTIRMNALLVLGMLASPATAFVVHTSNNQRRTRTTFLNAGGNANDMPFADRATSIGNEKAVSSVSSSAAEEDLAPPLEADMQVALNIDSPEPVKVQGGALRTWTTQSPEVDRMLLSMNTDGPPEGTPLLGLVELHQGPENTPMKMQVKSGKGSLRPIRCLIETPGSGHSLFIRNLEALEFPIWAKVKDCTSEAVDKAVHEMGSPKLLQGGGTVTSYPLDPNVSVVKVLLRTDGRPLNAAVELTQGPNAVKVLMEVYTEDGIEWPFYCLIETPGSENTIRVWSTGTVEFPLTVCVEPFLVEEKVKKDTYLLVD